MMAIAECEDYCGGFFYMVADDASCVPRANLSKKIGEDLKCPSMAKIISEALDNRHQLGVA